MVTACLLPAFLCRPLLPPTLLPFPSFTFLAYACQLSAQFGRRTVAAALLD
jgi:hypothetical protein